MFGWFKSKPVEITDMTDAEKNIIVRFASGQKMLRDEALSIHRKYLLIIGVRDTPEQKFMAEIDNPMPDLTLLEQYRSNLLWVGGGFIDEDPTGINVAYSKWAKEQREQRKKDAALS